ncbi:hypothetical protein ACUT56_003366 [Vibrio cholerae]|uniref:hypothetical protein n=1 Tax=Vibrio cholerae TaxID=666 RepID=UPI000A1DED7D|nr:hypothetical protein [Vibrio cholerae]EGQ7704235.1 hypothetical protein [Vibrio cholerae]EJL6546448.1 hypothetical protein [Vibrio cholerae]EJV7638425.1 hypothetical protein [Vibrio cholerae]EKF9150912.1 hypothetical protein [Vibrio cholerae]ELF3152103.1 hypothetical protein [Vibrio cholerae]
MSRATEKIEFSERLPDTDLFDYGYNRLENYYIETGDIEGCIKVAKMIYVLGIETEREFDSVYEKVITTCSGGKGN